MLPFRPGTPVLPASEPPRLPHWTNDTAIFDPSMLEVRPALPDLTGKEGTAQNLSGEAYWDHFGVPGYYQKVDKNFFTPDAPTFARS